MNVPNGTRIFEEELCGPERMVEVVASRFEFRRKATIEDEDFVVNRYLFIVNR